MAVLYVTWSFFWRIGPAGDFFCPSHPLTRSRDHVTFFLRYAPPQTSGIVCYAAPTKRGQVPSWSDLSAAAPENGRAAPLPQHQCSWYILYRILSLLLPSKFWRYLVISWFAAINTYHQKVPSLVVVVLGLRPPSKRIKSIRCTRYVLSLLLPSTRIWSIDMLGLLLRSKVSDVPGMC